MECFIFLDAEGPKAPTVVMGITTSRNSRSPKSSVRAMHCDMHCVLSPSMCLLVVDRGATSLLLMLILSLKNTQLGAAHCHTVLENIA